MEDRNGKYTNMTDINDNKIYVGDVFEIESNDTRIKNRFTRTVKEIRGEFYLVDEKNYGEPLKQALCLDGDLVGIARALKDNGWKYSKKV
jgi:hypothetical protein